MCPGAGVDPAARPAKHKDAMFKKILVANRGVLAAGKAKQIALARASARAMSRESSHV